MPPQISRIGFAPINDNQKRKLFAALKEVGERHGVSRAWWPAVRPGLSGRQFIMSYSVGNVDAVDEDKVAQVLADNTEWSYEQIRPFVIEVEHATGTIRNQLDQTMAYIANHEAEWEFEELPDWMAEPEEPVEFVEATKPDDWPEGEPWPRVSQPLEWVEVEIDFP